MSRNTLMSAAAGVSRSRRGGGGDPAIVAAFPKDYRFWARLPPAVESVLFLGHPTAPGPTDKLLAEVHRPTFPKGVCTGCGCSAFDACPGDFGEGCAWVDASETRCTSCGPAPAVEDVIEAPQASRPRRGPAPRRGRR